MRYEELLQITTIVDKVKVSAVYQTYIQTYQRLLADGAALTLLDAYHEAQDAYATSVVSRTQNAEMKEQAKRHLLQKKQEVNANPLIHDYFVMSRTIEFFLDDLNYEINHLIGKRKKTHCSTNRKAG